MSGKSKTQKQYKRGRVEELSTMGAEVNILLVELIEEKTAKSTGTRRRGNLNHT